MLPGRSQERPGFFVPGAFFKGDRPDLLRKSKFQWGDPEREHFFLGLPRFL